MASQQARAPLSAATAAPQQSPDLPEAAIACILRHVRLRQRLTCCALVCRAWAAAAAGVPAEVSTKLRSSEHCGQLQDWLSQHAGVVVSLINLPNITVYSGDPWGSWSPLQLPVDKLTCLRNLDLGWLKVQSARGVSTPSSISRRRGSSLTGESSKGTSGGSASGGSSATVALPQLQELGLCEVQLTVELLSQLLSATGLTGLHWSSVGLCKEMSPAEEDLPHEEVLSILWQHLQLLPKLSRLQLHVDSLTSSDIPATISPLSKLQHLQHLSLLVDYRPVSAAKCMALASAVLAALQHLTQLRHLELGCCQLQYRVQHLPQSDVSYQCFSALTASTQLTLLDIKEGDVPLPKAAFQYMLPTGRVLPNLKALCLAGTLMTEHCVEAAQVARIAASCPALQELKLQGVTPRSFDVSCLAQLPAGVTRVDGLRWTRSTP